MVYLDLLEKRGKGERQVRGIASLAVTIVTLNELLNLAHASIAHVRTRCLFPNGSLCLWASNFNTPSTLSDMNFM